MTIFYAGAWAAVSSALVLAACGDDAPDDGVGPGSSNACDARTCEGRTAKARETSLFELDEFLTTLEQHLTEECRSVHFVFGAEAPYFPDSAPLETKLGWCESAGGELAARGITLTVTVDECLHSTPAQNHCERNCNGSELCPASIEDTVSRCPEGQLFGGCAGTCSDCLDGGFCQGQCEGTCSGYCDNMNVYGPCDGECNGECLGPCTNNFESACTGCAGSCSVPITEGLCRTPLPPHAECTACATCESLCATQAARSAHCMTAGAAYGASEEDASVVVPLLALAKTRRQLELASDQVDAIGVVAAPSCSDDPPPPLEESQSRLTALLAAADAVLPD